MRLLLTGARKKISRGCIVFFGCCLCVIPLIISLSGCGSQKTNDGILIWHWMTDREAAFNELAQRYTDDTGIPVRFELYAPSDAYSQKIRASAQARTLPDIFGLLAEKRDFGSFIKAGHIADLTEAMLANDAEWKNWLFPKALAVNEFKAGNSFDVPPGIYGVPIDVTNIQMLYNKKLFAAAGLDPTEPPASWNDFIAACEALKKIGVQGLVSGWGEVWMIDCFASNYAFNIMGQDKVMATIAGDVPYTDPDWIKVFDIFREIRDRKMLSSGVVTMVNKQAEQIFASERAGFAFNGSWCVNVYEGMNPDLDYAAMILPRMSAEYPMRIWGGAGSSFMVNQYSPKKQKAIAFLKWLTAPRQQAFLSTTTHNLPANRASLEHITPILAQFADDMDAVTHPTVWPVHEFPLVIEAMDKGIQSILIGEMTPETLGSKVQAVKEREIAKAKKRL